MTKKEYILMMTEDGTVGGRDIATRRVQCDFLPLVGEKIKVTKGSVVCVGEVTRIVHSIDEDNIADVFVICKFVGTRL